MSKRNRGARNRARANRLAALRAELVLVMENKLEPHHLKYNHQQTAMLLEQFQWSREVPPWAQNYVRLGRLSRMERDVWRDELAPLPQQVFDDKADAYAQAMDAALLTGTGIVRLTPDQQPGTIMDMDSGNASGHDT